MKLHLVVLFLLTTLLCPAQTKKDIFNPDVPIVVLGADFSKIQFTKSEMFTNQSEILRFFVDCNNLLKSSQYEKYFRKGLKRDEIEMDFSYVTKVNEVVDWQKVYSDDTEYRLSDETIPDMIKNLNIDQKLYKGHIGMVFCEENYSKTKLLGTVAVVFFGVDDLKPIIIRHYSFKPSGFGFLYYWGSINTRAIGKLKSLYKELK